MKNTLKNLMISFIGMADVKKIKPSTEIKGKNNNFNPEQTLHNESRNDHSKNPGRGALFDTASKLKENYPDIEILLFVDEGISKENLNIISSALKDAGFKYPKSVHLEENVSRTDDLMKFCLNHIKKILESEPEIRIFLNPASGTAQIRLAFSNIYIHFRTITRIELFEVDEKGEEKSGLMDSAEIRELYNEILVSQLKSTGDFVVEDKTLKKIVVDTKLLTKMETNSFIKRAEEKSSGTSTIFIYGETGTGKEKFARLIYNEFMTLTNNTEKVVPFRAFNCSGLKEDIADSQLFGYIPGAFTGASEKGNEGIIHNSKFLFLDETGELSQAVQAKLLRFLQDGTYWKVGDSKELHTTNCFIVLATNNLTSMRPDFFSRVIGSIIRLPSLKDLDVKHKKALISSFFNQELSPDNTAPSENVIEILASLDMSFGNVRLLKSLIKRLIALSDNNVITKEMILNEYNYFQSFIKDLDGTDFVIEEKLAKLIIDNGDFNKTLEGIENRTLEILNARFKTQANLAKAINIKESTLSNKLKKTQC
ncbi:MAG: sigma 54-interacting transcriptional regulator [Deltaproteobacteria bacterium]|nr:sigma 54-interacting transcriptional regulator [Deltaproteobacteria bacterium]